MSKRSSIWLGLGAFALAQAVPLALDGHLTSEGGGFAKNAWADGGEGGEAGKGHDDEGPDLDADDTAYLTQLALIEGHFLVGVRLYHQGEKSDAKSHMKHPGDELYAALNPAFKTRKVHGFADGLETLASAVASGASGDDVDAAYDGVTKQIAAARIGIAAMHNTTFLVAANLVREAAEDYAIGVKDGKIVNAHEYQDSLGFAGMAEPLVRSIASSEPAREAAVELAKLAPAWPSLVPPDALRFEVSLMHGVATKLELLAQRAK
ncbi:MAG: hypothetical protein EXQ99_06250 [Alphaproteobacteria bacterium]|nr:hypothetical protein [Alphaproteobacteria bacterium]